MPLPRFFAVDQRAAESPEKVVAALNAAGYWLVPLGRNSHPFQRDGSRTAAPGDYSTTRVGDETDTSPYPDSSIMGISVRAYVRNMSVLIRFVQAESR